MHRRFGRTAVPLPENSPRVALSDIIPTIAAVQIPLRQQYIGVSEQNYVTRNTIMNTICYEKVLGAVKDGKQAMVFVHSRKVGHVRCWGWLGMNGHLSIGT